MSKIQKISIFFIATVILLNIIGNITVNAKTYPIEKADLYSKGEVIYFYYNGIKIGVEVVMHKKDGIEYPAYCINKGTPGVTSQEGYTVTVEEVLGNEKVRRAIINGYPFVSYEQLGCANEKEAFAATKMAVYDALYEPYDLEKFKPIGEEGERVVSAIKNIITKSRNSNETKLPAYLTIEPITDWNVDSLEKQYISKEYQIKASANIKNYQINIQENSELGIKLVDKDNKEKDTFEKLETFKILLPISELQRTGDIKLEAKADLETKSVFLGKSPSSNLQNYALIAGSYEEGIGKMQEEYPENKTEIVIQKQDNVTKQALEGGIFQLLNEEKKVIQSEIITNENGIAEIKDILPGKYYIKEIKSPDGYLKEEELISVQVEFNEIYKVIVNNQKEEKKIINDEKEKQIEIGVKKLPKTGY